MTFRFAPSRYWVLAASLALVLFSLALLVPTAHAASAGPSPPTATVSGGAFNQFANPLNALSSNDQYATGTNAQKQGYTGFGFSVASGSTVNGIVVTVEGNKGTCDLNSPKFTVLLSQDGGSTWVGNSQPTSNLGSSDTTTNLGSSSDLWGLTWTPSQINSLAVRTDAGCTGGGAPGSKVVDLDFVSVTVYYTPPPSNVPCSSGLAIPVTGSPAQPGAMPLTAAMLLSLAVLGRRKAKGLAPVVATLLLIAIASGIAVVVFAWSQGFLGNASGAVGSQQGAQNQASQSSISIESMTFTAGTSGSNALNTPVITIVIRNVGSVTVTLGSASINGPSTNAGFKGSLVVSTLSTSGSVTSTDGSWTYNLAATSIAKGACDGLVLTQGTEQATIPMTQVLVGDLINAKVTTTVGTFAAAQYAVP